MSSLITFKLIHKILNKRLLPYKALFQDFEILEDFKGKPTTMVTSSFQLWFFTEKLYLSFCLIPLHEFTHYIQTFPQYTKISFPRFGQVSFCRIPLHEFTHYIQTLPQKTKIIFPRDSNPSRWAGSVSHLGHHAYTSLPPHSTDAVSSTDWRFAPAAKNFAPRPRICISKIPKSWRFNLSATLSEVGKIKKSQGTRGCPRNLPK